MTQSVDFDNREDKISNISCWKVKFKIFQTVKSLNSEIDNLFFLNEF